MAQSINKIFLHIIFHVKTTSPKILEGYAAYSVSQSVVDKVIEYVSNQKEHHQKMTFEEEYIQFLKLHNIAFDERYVFVD